MLCSLTYCHPALASRTGDHIVSNIQRTNVAEDFAWASVSEIRSKFPRKVVDGVSKHAERDRPKRSSSSGFESLQIFYPVARRLFGRNFVDACRQAPIANVFKIHWDSHGEGLSDRLLA